MQAARPVVVGAAAVLLAGCGGSKPPSLASVRAMPPSQTQLQGDLLKFAECMRSNGVPSFPDPSAGGGFEFSPGSGVDPSSPAMKVAQGRCRRLMPGGGPPGPGAVTHPAAQWLAQMERAAQCMRRHGVADFPDPRTSVATNPFPNGGTGVISDIDGVIFVFPSTLDTQSPAFVGAAKTCGFPLHNH